MIVNRAIEDEHVSHHHRGHELGYSFGLWHVSPDERRSLMNPGNKSIGPTEEDVAEVPSLLGELLRATDPLAHLL